MKPGTKNSYNSLTSIKIDNKDFKIFKDDAEVYKQRVIGKDTAKDVLESLKLVSQSYVFLIYIFRNWCKLK